LGLKAFIAKRIVYSVFLLLAIIIIDFVIFILMPGDPTMFLVPLDPSGGTATPEVIQRREQILREVWGFGEPFQVKLFKYMRNLLTWQFGVSFLYKTDVSKELGWRIPYTVFLIGGSTLISIVVGIVWGVYVVHKRGSFFDSASVVISLITGSLPTFWLAMVLLLFFSLYLGWFPNAGAFPREWAGLKWPKAFDFTVNGSANGMNIFLHIDPQETFRLISGYALHAFLPMLTLFIFSVGGWVIYTRAVMLDVITEDYITTARAKGLKEETVLFKHGLKNAALPIITSAALAFGFILSGAMITEAVYTYPGLGQFTFQAIFYKDYSILMAVFYIVSICVIVANIVADLLYGVLDPRIRYG
jgi:peptide/nickel transport system permease protein